MVRVVSEAADQSVAALFLPARLRALRDAVAELSDRVSRRYFALLPAARTVGIEAPVPTDARCGMIYRVRHMTRYDYQSPVDLGAHLAHLRPRPLPHQRVLRAGVHAAPAVSWRRDGNDHFGNEVTWLFLDVAHAAFQVVAESTVDVGFPAPPDPAATLPWETVAERAWEAGPAAWQAAEFVFDSPRAAADAGAKAYAARLLPARPSGAGGVARSERSDPAGLHLPRRGYNDQHAYRGGAAASPGRVPGFHPPDDQCAARFRPAGTLRLRLYPHPSVPRADAPPWR